MIDEECWCKQNKLNDKTWARDFHPPFSHAARYRREKATFSYNILTTGKRRSTSMRNGNRPNAMEYRIVYIKPAALPDIIASCLTEKDRKIHKKNEFLPLNTLEPSSIPRRPRKIKGRVRQCGETRKRNDIMRRMRWSPENNKSCI